MEIRRLRYFLAVAEELHFGRAAARLHMAQPPLSQQIRKLEDELGVTLFDRTSRRVALTEAGRMFLAGTRRAMEEVDRATHAAQQAERGLLGHLVMGFVSSASVTFMPSLLRHLRGRIPDLHPEVRLFGSDAVQDALQRRILDLGFLRHAPASVEFASRVIFRDEIVVALPVTHPLASRKAVHVSLLRDEFFVLFPPYQRSAVNRVIDRVFKKAGFTPRASQIGEDIFIMLGLVGAGLGVAFLPASLANFAVDGVAFRPLAGVRERFDIWLAWRADDKRAIVATAVDAISRSWQPPGAIARKIGRSPSHRPPP